VAVSGIGFYEWHCVVEIIVNGKMISVSRPLYDFLTYLEAFINWCFHDSASNGLVACKFVFYDCILCRSWLKGTVSLTSLLLHNSDSTTQADGDRGEGTEAKLDHVTAE